MKLRLVVVSALVLASLVSCGRAETDISSSAIVELREAVEQLVRSEGHYLQLYSDRIDAEIESAMLLLGDYSHYVVFDVGEKTTSIFQYAFDQDERKVVLQASLTGAKITTRLSKLSDNDELIVEEANETQIRAALRHFLDGEPLDDRDAAVTYITTLIDKGWLDGM